MKKIGILKLYRYLQFHYFVAIWLNISSANFDGQQLDFCSYVNVCVCICDCVLKKEIKYD
jgi:hypothetical protein